MKIPHNTIRKHKNTQKGYILLLSVLISGIILAIAIGIANLTLKGLVLASIGKNSQYAFYAADTGGECALYWDINGDGAGTVFPVSSSSVPPTSGVDCVGEDIATNWDITTTPTSATTEFTINIAGGGCAQVIVSKTNSGDDTQIESHGFNSCSLSSARRVERVLRVNY